MSDWLKDTQRRGVYGVKKEVRISAFCRDKLDAIASQSNRPLNTIFTFCIRHAIFIGTYNNMPYGMNWVKPDSTVGVRLPRPLLSDLSDLAWNKGISQSKFLDYLLYVSLGAKSVDKWITFFKEGEDLVFNFWMYIYRRNLCPTSYQYYQGHLSLPKQKTY
jgi:hypothetical protein